MPTYPLTMVIQPAQASKSGLVLPCGKWNRLDDGSIEVTFDDPITLWVCIEATKEIRDAQRF